MTNHTDIDNNPGLGGSRDRIELVARLAHFWVQQQVSETLLWMFTNRRDIPLFNHAVVWTTTTTFGGSLPRAEGHPAIWFDIVRTLYAEFDRDPPFHLIGLT